MNPINDEKDSTEVEESSEHLKDTNEDEDLKDKDKKISANFTESSIDDQNSNELKENQEVLEEIHDQTENAAILKAQLTEVKSDDILKTEVSEDKNDEILEADVSEGKSDENLEAQVSEDKNDDVLEADVSEGKNDEILKANVSEEDKNRIDLKKQTEIIHESQDEESKAKVENENESSCEGSVKENSKEEHKMKEYIESSGLEEANNKLETDVEVSDDVKDLNTDPATEDYDDDESEEFENVEDVEIPGEEEVDEIIVPDEAEAEDLTDGKDHHNEELDKSQNRESDDEEDQSLKESDEEDNESEINLHEADEEITKSSAAGEKDDENEDAASAKKSLKSCQEAAELLVLGEVTNNESCMEQSKPDQTNLDEDSTTQNSYDPLNCTGNKEDDDDDGDGDGENVSVKNVESENSNDSQTPEKEEQNEETNSSSKNEESENDNSVESQAQKNYEHEEDDEVQFVETRNSPICIESDDDETVNTKDTTDTPLRSPTNNNNNRIDSNRRIITTATTTVTVPRNITVTRTSARKSTAKPPQTPPIRASNSPAANVPQIQNKPRNFSYLKKSTTSNTNTFTGASTQQIVDCIELLDSSDEESAAKISQNTQKSAQQQRTPQKRTLLAAKGNFYKNSTNSKVPNAAVNRLPHNFTPPVRQQPKKPAPPPLPPATPQSNFLNAVQLQPAAVTGANPPAFSALLSNKNVIIPNAFYGNPPSIRSTSSDTEAERRSARWLENFLNQFCKPQFEPTHSCFVFLQRALKYKDFVRIKALRTSMNSHAQNASNQLNIELMTDLKTIFFKNVKKISNYGQRFCELTCTTTAGKAVTLITHRLSGKITLKTCNMELPKPLNSNSAANASTSSSLSSHASTSNTSVSRKRQLDEDEDEYTPDKSLYKTKGKPPSENGGGGGEEDSGDTGDDRKRSLRTKRTKRIDNSFSYNEDDLLAEYEIDDADDEKLAQVEIQRKIEQKRLEAQKQRQQQAKSFESAFIQAFAKSIDGPTTSTKTKNNNNASSSSSQRIRLRNTATATVTNIKQYTANNDAEDLLQATWIETLENDNTQIISDDDEPQQHRIYKQPDELHQDDMQQQQQQPEYYTLCKSLTISKVPSTYPSSKHGGRTAKRTANRNQEEFITGDDDYENINYNAKKSLYAQSVYWPKNVDPQMTVTGKNKDRCVICSLNCQRLVHHYVNEHRGCETYNSRLSATQIKKLKQGNCTASVSLYKNGQNLYEAFCIFCNKVSRFMLRYWYQHYTMHTGEYAYRCTGCGIRKPTQSLLTLHHTQGCPEVGAGIIQDYAYDAKSLQIEAKICSLCNYLQLHRSNIVKHLHTQHNIKQILPKHIVTVGLMKIPAYLAAGTTSSTITNSAPTANANRRSLGSNRSSTAAFSSSGDTFVIEDDETDMTMYEEILPEESSQPPPENHYYNYIPPYMQAAFNSGNLSFENVDAGDDLSFMICGMLDVQMNTNDAN